MASRKDQASSASSSGSRRSGAASAAASRRGDAASAPGEPDTLFRRGIFRPGGRSEILSRTVFYGINAWFAKRLGGGDGRMLWRSLLALAALGALLILLLSATPADPFAVWNARGYEEPSILYALDEEGKPMPIAEFYWSARRVIELDESGPRGMDARVVRAFIATEDNHFLSHPGVDPVGILRAALVNLMAGGVREGASTITQQAARLHFSFLSRERSFVRKAREAIVALWMELRYSKREIMEIYLNSVPLGRNNIGVEAAARFYFDKSFHELSWGDAAVLTSLTTRPNDLNPFEDPQESIQKVRIVFRRLVENGDLSPAEAEAEFRKLEREFYAVIDRSPNDAAITRRMNRHPYVTEWVRRIVEKRVGRYGPDGLYRGGYRIYTTIRAQHQAAAEEEFQPYLREQTRRRSRAPFRNFDAFSEEFADLYQMTNALFALPDFKIRISRDERQLMRAFVSEMEDELEFLGLVSGEQNLVRSLQNHRQEGFRVVEESQEVEGGLISIDPRTGAITAVVGGSGFESRNQLLRWMGVRRQPGSAFKPIVYAAALEWSARNPSANNKLTAATMIDDSPVQFIDADLSEYSPENYSRSYEGLIRLRRGLTLSKNAVAVRVYERMGSAAINPIAEELLRFDVENRKLPPEAAVALGAYGVSPYEMVRAYAAFANGGLRVEPYILSHVETRDGRVVMDNREQARRAQANARRVLRPGTAQIITSMLEDVVQEGTGRAARLGGRRAAGKTGTTNRGANAWFVGYTPQLVTALYIGYDTPMSLGYGATGGGLAAPVWGRYMYRALAGTPAASFDFTGSDVVRVEICKQTGMLPGPRCPERMVEMFLPGTAPTKQGEEDFGSQLEDLSPGRLQMQDEGDIFRDEDFD